MRLCSSNALYNDVSDEDVDDYDSSEESEEDLEDRPYCPMCEYIVGELDRYMTDNQTEEYIQETVEQICDMLRYVLIQYETTIRLLVIFQSCMDYQ